MNANPPTVLPGSFFKKKTTTLQLFLSRSEDVRVIGYDMDFFFWKYNINFFPNDGLVVQ